jgi:hypothetical protein
VNVADETPAPHLAKSARIVQHGYEGTRHIEIEGTQIPWFTGGSPPSVTPERGMAHLTFTVIIDGDVEFVREEPKPGRQRLEPVRPA